jgi:hypothetical protein
MVNSKTVKALIDKSLCALALAGDQELNTK